MSVRKSFILKDKYKDMSDTKKDKTIMSVKKKDTTIDENLSPFIKNEHHKFVVLKTEKLASALYLITGFVSETDPLRTKIRTCALDLVSSSVNPESSKTNNSFSETFGSRCLEISTMLNMAERAGLVSEMNSRVLCDEYASLAAFVNSNSGKICETESVNFNESLPSAISSIRQTNQVRNSAPKRTYSDKRHSDRKSLILKLLETKDSITVKEATSAIEGCSEKTVQRELLGLVESGVLLKEGERRWSVYKKA